MEPRERIILALDVDSERKALELVEKLADSVGAFKVGMQLYNMCGPQIVERIQKLGGRVFVDLKFHDIPNTVAAAARVMTRLNSFMFNVHAAGGREMMAATLAEGTTYIENAALEPEIVDLANFMNSMGARITGAGSNVIKIEGVKKLHSTVYTPIPDRIEAGTYMVAAAATAGDVLIKNVIPEHLKAVTAKLLESNAVVEEQDDHIRVYRQQDIKPVYIKTLPYPGFPTDMQAQFMAYLSLGRGSSVITESVFENRFMHVAELLRMGAKIKTEGRTAVIKGCRELTGARVRATDLRAGAALMIAGLMARGPTIIMNSEHIDRGYENIVAKLNGLGANIQPS